MSSENTKLYLNYYILKLIIFKGGAYVGIIAQLCLIDYSHKISYRIELKYIYIKMSDFQGDFTGHPQ